MNPTYSVALEQIALDAMVSAILNQMPDCGASDRGFRCSTLLPHPSRCLSLADLSPSENFQVSNILSVEVPAASVHHADMHVFHISSDSGRSANPSFHPELYEKDSIDR